MTETTDKVEPVENLSEEEQEGWQTVEDYDRLQMEKAECIVNCLLMDKQYDMESYKEPVTYFTQEQTADLVGKLYNLLMDL